MLYSVIDLQSFSQLFSLVSIVAVLYRNSTGLTNTDFSMVPRNGLHLVWFVLLLWLRYRCEFFCTRIAFIYLTFLGQAIS